MITLAGYNSTETIHIGSKTIVCRASRTADNQQVLLNLIINAYQAMPTGGELIVQAEVKQDMVQISIKDSGHGMTPETQQKIFEPLFSAKTHDIGLAVSKNLVDINGGTLAIESLVAQGVTFTIRLPFKRNL